MSTSVTLTQWQIGTLDVALAYLQERGGYSPVDLAALKDLVRNASAVTVTPYAPPVAVEFHLYRRGVRLSCYRDLASAEKRAAFMSSRWPGLVYVRRVEYASPDDRTGVTTIVARAKDGDVKAIDPRDGTVRA